MDEKCENCDERYECNSGLGCLKAMSPQPAPSEPQGEPLIGGGLVDPETGVYTANEKRLGGMNNPTKNMQMTLRGGLVLNEQSISPVEGCASKYCVTKAPYHNQAGWSHPKDDGCSCLAPLGDSLAQLIKTKLRDYAQLQDAVNRRGLM